MNAALSHEMSQANYLKYDASIVAEHDHWQKYHNLVVDMCSLFKFPNLARKFSKNVSKSLNKGDCHSNKGANKARAMPNNKVSRSPT
jgi:hypothetical protein